MSNANVRQADMPTDSVTAEQGSVFSATDEDQLKDYRSLCGPAFAGLLLALASPLAFVRPILLIIPAAAVVLCLAALGRIARSEGRLAGKWAALFGLCVASICFTAMPAYILARNAIFNRHAEPVALQWFDLLRLAEPHKALQLTLPIMRRQATDDLWGFYRRDEEARSTLNQFVDREDIALLLSLGERAEIQCYEHGKVGQIPSQGFGIQQVYAVTYPDDQGQRHTFFVAMQLQRSVSASGEVVWRVISFEGGVDPANLEV